MRPECVYDFSEYGMGFRSDSNKVMTLTDRRQKSFHYIRFTCALIFAFIWLIVETSEKIIGNSPVHMLLLFRTKTSQYSKPKL